MGGAPVPACARRNRITRRRGAYIAPAPVCPTPLGPGPLLRLRAGEKRRVVWPPSPIQDRRNRFRGIFDTTVPLLGTEATRSKYRVYLPGGCFEVHWGILLGPGPHIFTSMMQRVTRIPRKTVLLIANRATNNAGIGQNRVTHCTPSPLYGAGLWYGWGWFVI